MPTLRSGLSGRVRVQRRGQNAPASALGGAGYGDIREVYSKKFAGTKDARGSYLRQRAQGHDGGRPGGRAVQTAGGDRNSATGPVQSKV